MELQSKIDGLEYLTDEGINVTKRIEDGRTIKFKKRVPAEDFAHKIGSYVYDLSYYKANSKKADESCERIIKTYGYAVPK